jgi:hypothetical protein
MKYRPTGPTPTMPHLSFMPVYRGEFIASGLIKKGHEIARYS